MSLEKISSPLLNATKQNVTLARYGVGFFGGVGIIYLSNVKMIVDILPLAPFVAATLGTILAISSALLAIYTVRCPKCHLKWLYWALSHRPVGDWLHWLYRFTECPECKFQIIEEINNS